MNNLFTLISMMMKSSTFATNAKSKTKRSRFSSGNPVFYSFLTSLIFLIILTVSSLSGLSTMPAQDFDDYISSNLVLNLVGLSLIFSSTYIFSSFFLSTDNANYLHLPLSSQTIFTARFFSSFVLGCTAPLACPLSFYLCRLIGGLPFNFMTFLNPLLFYFAVEFICSSVVFLFGILLSEAFRLRKHRQVMIAFELIFILAGSFIFGFLTSMNSASFFHGSLALIINAVQSTGDLLVGLYALLIGIGFLVLTYLIARRLYLKSMLGANESRKKKKKRNKIEQDQFFDTSFKKYTKHQNVFLAYLKDELRTIFRSGTYLFSFFITTLIIGVSLIVAIPISFQSLVGTAAFSPAISVMLFAIFNQMVGIVSLSSGVVYSKDRLSFIGISILPVNQKKIFIAKLLPATLEIIALNIIFSALYCALFPIDLLVAALYFIGTIFTVIGVNYTSQIFDLFFGNSNAPNELSVTRNNKNAILSSLYSVVMRIVFGLIPLLSLVLTINKLIIPLISLTLALAVFIIPFILTYSKIEYYAQRFVQRSNS